MAGILLGIVLIVCGLLLCFHAAVPPLVLGIALIVAGILFVAGK